MTKSSVYESHEADRRTIIGAYFSGRAFIMVINEMAVTLAGLLPHVGALVKLAPAQTEELERGARVLEGAVIGSLTLESYRETLEGFVSQGEGKVQGDQNGKL
jgi:hypothetical protein